MNGDEWDDADEPREGRFTRMVIVDERPGHEDRVTYGYGSFPAAIKLTVHGGDLLIAITGEHMVTRPAAAAKQRDVERDKALQALIESGNLDARWFEM